MRRLIFISPCASIASIILKNTRLQLATPFQMFYLSGFLSFHFLSQGAFLKGNQYT